MGKREQHKAIYLIIFIAVILTVIVVAAGKHDEPFGFMRVHSPEDAILFLSELGWSGDISAVTMQDTVIPNQFDDTFIGYNCIQIEQGCDLTRYAGKSITVYTIPITNYHASEEQVLATLLVYRGTVIGGDLHSAAMNGFMHTLR